MKNNIAIYLLLVLIVASCNKKQEKPLDVDVDVNAYIDPEPDVDQKALEEKEKMYERNFSEMSVEDFINDVKEKNYTSFYYYLNGEKVQKSSRLTKINKEFLEMINNGKFLVSLSLKNIDEIRESKGKIDRNMQIKLQRYEIKEEEIEPFFVKLKELLDQLAEK